MNENIKAKRPIILSMPVIILVSICTLTILAPVSLIMSILRFKKYPELKNKNFICLGISIAMMIALIMFANMPDGDKQISTSEVNGTEVTKVEETQKVEAVVESKTEEVAKEEPTETSVEDAGLFGYPEQEKELTDAQVNISDIPSRECFLYTYAEFKILADHMDLKDMPTIESAVWDYVSDTTGMPNYEIIDTIVFSYAGDNLANYIPDYLLPLVGDECNDVVDSAMETYYGYTPDTTSDSAASIGTAEIGNVEALDGTNDEYHVVDYGSYTKEQIYDSIEAAYNNPNIEYTTFTKDIIRDLSNIGQPVSFSCSVDFLDKTMLGIRIPDQDYLAGYVDSSLTDITIFQNDKILVNCVFLGLNGDNRPIFEAISITVE